MIESIEFLSTSTFTHAFFPPLALPPSLPPSLPPRLHFLGYTRQTSGETGSAISQINTCVIIIVIIIILMVPIVPDFRCTHKARNKLGAMEAFLNTFPQDAPILLPSKASMHCENCTYCYYWFIFSFITIFVQVLLCNYLVCHFFLCIVDSVQGIVLKLA